MKNVKVIKKAAIFLMVFVLAFSSLMQQQQLLIKQVIVLFATEVRIIKYIIIVRE